MPDGHHMLLDQVYHFIPLRNSSLTLVAGSRMDYHPTSDPRTESSRRSSYYSGCKSDLESSLTHIKLHLGDLSFLPGRVVSDFMRLGDIGIRIGFYQTESRRLPWKFEGALANEN